MNSRLSDIETADKLIDLYDLLLRLRIVKRDYGLETDALHAQVEHQINILRQGEDNDIQ